MNVQVIPRQSHWQVLTLNKAFVKPDEYEINSQEFEKQLKQRQP